MSGYKNGQVILPIERYNSLLNKASAFERAIKVEKGWSDNVDISIDTNFIYEYAAEAFAQSQFNTDEYILLEQDEIYVSNIRIAKKAKESTEDN